MIERTEPARQGPDACGKEGRVKRSHRAKNDAYLLVHLYSQSGGVGEEETVPISHQPPIGIASRCGIGKSGSMSAKTPSE